MKRILNLLVTSTTISILAIGGTTGVAAAANDQFQRVAIPAPADFTPAEPPLPAAAHRTIFLNRNGGIYHMGPDDSRTNTSSIMNAATSGANLPPYPWGDASWAQVLQCVKDTYAPFNVTVTDQDPGMATHVEVVVTTSADTIGQGPTVGGVAQLPATCTTPINEDAVVYDFSSSWGGNINEDCWTIAQESAHAFGLDHEYLCADPMTYRQDCSNLKRFQNVDSPCGEFMERPCICGTTQNSVMALLATLGPADASPPTLDVTSPHDGDTVKLGFVVTANASDNTGIGHVEVEIDGVMSSAIDGIPPYEVPTPKDITLGMHTLEVRAYDSGGNFTPAILQVNVVSACSSAADCGPDQLCSADACFGDLGSTCTGPTDCMSAICIQDPKGVQVCSQSCDTDACPSGFKCEAPPAGGTNKCFAGGGGGCAANPGGGDRLPVALGGLFMGLLLVVGLRRRRAA